MPQDDGEAGARAPADAHAPQVYSYDDVQAAAQAGFEVLAGAQAQRVLELAQEITLCKGLLWQLARGRLVLATPDMLHPAPAQPPAATKPPTAAQTRRSTKKKKARGKAAARQRRAT